MLGCADTVSAIQGKVGVRADGILGQRTITAILERLTRGIDQKGITTPEIIPVVIDIGHTTDYAREHPHQFKVDWSAGVYKEIADTLGFDKTTNDSLEHLLNTAIVKSIVKHLDKDNALVIDEPSMTNNAEITMVYNKVNQVKPKIFLSIHNNSSGQSKWTTLGNTACGSVGCWYNPSSKPLANTLATALSTLRKQTGGVDNRADHNLYSGVAVLKKSTVALSVLLEVCFYDNLNDLLWTVRHLDQIGQTIAKTIDKTK